jgi:hypothetical protein
MLLQYFQTTVAPNCRVVIDNRRVVELVVVVATPTTSRSKVGVSRILLSIVGGG